MIILTHTSTLTYMVRQITDPGVSYDGTPFRRPPVAWIAEPGVQYDVTPFRRPPVAWIAEPGVRNCWAWNFSLRCKIVFATVIVNQTLRLRISDPQYMGLRISDPQYMGLRISDPQYEGLRISDPQYVGLGFSEPQCVGLRNGVLQYIYTMSFFLHTPRLALREFTLSDAPFILQLVNDPGWLAFIGDRKVYSVEDAENYLRNGPLKGYAEQGFGSWAVCLRGTGEPIGSCGILKRDYLDVPDLGYAFLEAHTGKGYGSEAAAAVMEHVTKTYGIKHLKAFATFDNERSLGLLRKMGFRDAGTIVVEGEELALYEWRKSRRAER